MVIDLQPPVSESLTSISKVYVPTNYEHRFHKVRSENWLPIGFNLELP